MWAAATSEVITPLVAQIEREERLKRGEATLAIAAQLEIDVDRAQNGWSPAGSRSDPRST
jgi:hypothetical protein